nr:MAG TPA: hypothetical protein [Caudoviricetes sp.]
MINLDYIPRLNTNGLTVVKNSNVIMCFVYSVV